MSTLVTFYALTDADAIAKDKTGTAATNESKIIQASTTASVAERELKKAAELLLGCVPKRMKATVLCDTQTQAEALDEFIWQYPPDKFIPHNLFGEGPAAGTPAEIVWQSAYLSMTKLRNRQFVINLSGEYIERHHDIMHIIDFVPEDEDQKAAARLRYKQYKQAGCQLEYKTAQLLCVNVHKVKPQ